jgi:hypothetical protein
MATDTRIHASTFAGFDTPNSMVTITMSTDQARALRDYIDTVDIPDISQNPGTYGLSDDDAADFSNVLGLLAGALGKVYPY